MSEALSPSFSSYSSSLDPIESAMATEKIDHTHLLFAHPSDTPGSVWIPVQLTGSEYYELWRRSMKIALQAKRKLGFVIGTCTKDSFMPELHEDWEI